MALKLFRGVWFLSVLVVFAALMYTYAGLPEHVVVQEEASGQITMGRDPLFYLVVAAIVVVNVMVYLIRKMYLADLDFRAWFHGLVITINIFFVIALAHLALYNSTEYFDYSRIGFIIYGSVVLIVLWAVSWPVYQLYRKIFVKQVV
jgi:phage-related holin